MRDIIIEGLTQNNLKNINLSIPHNKIIIFTGLSGSGKSSIVFDTIAAESQRQMNETYPSFVRSRLPKHEKPSVERIENLLPSVVVDQSRLVGNARSTVGTITDIYASLRLLYSRFGWPHIGSASRFSFNDPAGMCLTCSGMGFVAEPNINKVIDANKSLNSGMIALPAFQPGKWYWKQYAHSGLFDCDIPWRDYSIEAQNLLLYGSPTKDGERVSDKIEGIYHHIRRLLIDRDQSQVTERKNLPLDILQYTRCPDCRGKRLNALSLSSYICGYNISDMCQMEIVKLRSVLAEFDCPAASTLVQHIQDTLTRMIDIGMPYLNLNRETSTLSGGEAQRLKLVRYLGSSLTGMLYIFDEPSTGLHPRDVYRMTNLLKALREKGNTVLVVEHDKDVIEIADVVVDVGPKSGAQGGQIVFQGTYEDLLRSNTLTGNALKQQITIKPMTRQPNHYIAIKNANTHNLKNVSVDIPLGVFTVVTGVAGSGKSSLMRHAFAEQCTQQLVMIDQLPITATNRSTPASFLGIFDDIRKLLAKENHVDVGMFSFNSEGGCPDCGGHGFIKIEMAFMDPITTTCETCAGKRYHAKALSYTYRGKSILDILNLTAEEALSFFQPIKKITSALNDLCRVGLGYLTLGQPLSTLSGGERQRLKLARELKNKGNIYLFDEPTTGLHACDIANLLELLNELVDAGNSVIVIEHNIDVMKQADYIIDVGPDGGSAGGEIVFTGTPKEMIQSSNSITAQYIRKSLNLEQNIDQTTTSEENNDMTALSLTTIGHISSINDQYKIVLKKEYIQALEGLDGFSAIQIVWWFTGCDNAEDRAQLTQQKPYKKGPEILGTFATRAPQRPNPIAITCADITYIDMTKGEIGLTYIDAFEGTPVLDIKPYTPSLDRIEAPQTPDWCKHWPSSIEKNEGFKWEDEFNF